MWLDYKLLDKDLLKVVDTLYSCFITDYESYKGCELRSSSCTKIKNVFKCLIYNFGYTVNNNKDYITITLQKRQYSKPLIYNCTEVNRKVSFTHMREVVLWLDSTGICNLVKGDVISWKDIGGKPRPDRMTQSKLYLGDELKNLIKNNTKVVPTIPSVLLLKDKNKNIITKPLGKYEKYLINLLNSYNYSSRNFSLEVGERKLDIQIHKVFNNGTFQEGGRSYVIGVDSDIMNKENRVELTIDGAPTVELDYKSLHPRLLCELDGLFMDHTFLPYNIQLEGYDDDVLKRICKVALLTVFNAKSITQAVGAVTKELRDLKDEHDKPLVPQWKANGLVPKTIEVKRIIQELCEHNIYIADHFFTGCGTKLQNLDSRIMDIILQKFLDADEFCLPVHDSIVVEERLSDFAIESMEDAYEQVMGSKINCIVEKK